MKCTKCGTELRGNAVFCDVCGTKAVPNVIRCKSCGYALRDISQFCDKCGARVDEVRFADVPVTETFDITSGGENIDLSSDESTYIERNSNPYILQNQFQGNYAAGDDSNANSNSFATPNSPKFAKSKRKKWIWITSIILLVVLSASAGALYYMHLNGKSTLTVKEPVKEDSNAIVSISAGDEHTVGLKKDGTVVAVGLNDYGQCDVDVWNK